MDFLLFDALIEPPRKEWTLFFEERIEAIGSIILRSSLLLSAAAAAATAANRFPLAHTQI